ncbi:hypothetical protein HYQ45_000552 [Verticillium longisporum]|uniref:Uncharacterized protein n=2 Tax=Verticillium TaxID=1036719 RepID=A0A8I3A2J3_VERLO|nr:hypothetical protein HYQ45_000552 [Verticillium longisporum]RXG48887.1 hypothetical protein VDGE_30372 [Verticillium dahliae]
MLSRKFHTHPVTKHRGQRLILTKHAAQTKFSHQQKRHTSTSSGFHVNIEAHRSRKPHHTIQSQESRAYSRQRTYPATFGWPSYARCADSHAT